MQKTLLTWSLNNSFKSLNRSNIVVTVLTLSQIPSSDRAFGNILKLDISSFSAVIHLTFDLSSIRPNRQWLTSHQRLELTFGPQTKWLLVDWDHWLELHSPRKKSLQTWKTFQQFGLSLRPFQPTMWASSQELQVSITTNHHPTECHLFIRMFSLVPLKII